MLTEPVTAPIMDASSVVISTVQDCRPCHRHNLVAWPIGTKLARPRTLTPCLQSTPRLSETVGHLVLRHEHIRCDRLASGPVVVSFGGQHRTWLIDLILISSP